MFISDQMMTQYIAPMIIIIIMNSLKCKLFRFNKKKNNSLRSIKDLSIIVSNTTTKHLEPVFLNVYDLLPGYRTLNCLFKYCACHLLGVYHTVSVILIKFHYQ